MPATSPCSLRSNETGSKGGVHSEEPAPGNKYNQNFRNRFCGCAEEYDPHTEKGTMFQCIGLGSVEDGGCGEDWWHPECVVGLPRNWNQREKSTAKITTNGTEDLSNGHAQDVGSTVEDGNAGDSAAVQLAAEQDDDPPMPPDFPSEDQFEHFICSKCVEAFPWIKRYAGNDGFLPGVSHKPQDHSSNSNESGSQAEEPTTSKKRKADYTGDTLDVDLSVKRQKSEEGTAVNGDAHREIGTAAPTSPCSYEKLPPAPSGPISLFLKEDFRSHLCRCSTHFPLLKPHPALLDDELTYSPPLSRSSSPAPGSVGSRSLLERGEAALSNVDRVRAIEGVMVYNHLRDKVKDFLRPYAETGQAVGAEDIKQYFEQLRGDQEAIKQAGVRADGNNDDTDGGGDSRREQSGY
ncbi:MAG: hypothetical protein M1821_008720 [Bathelium mastoideum]|nr:MAG: hypothetical protein M1821_008720 [Bathelium mastoideum]